MEKEYYSINDIRRMILNRQGKLYFMDTDAYGNIIEVEFTIESRGVGAMLVRVCRFYTSYLRKVTEIDAYPYTIEKKDFHKIKRSGKFL